MGPEPPDPALPFSPWPALQLHPTRALLNQPPGPLTAPPGLESFLETPGKAAASHLAPTPDSEGFWEPPPHSFSPPQEAPRAGRKQQGRQVSG